MMKNKANAGVAAAGRRGISLLPLQGSVGGGKDKGRAKATLSLLITPTPYLPLPYPGQSLLRAFGG